MPLPRRAALAGLAGAAILPGRARASAPLVEVTFLHINDVYQHAPQEGHGGLAELATLIERERARASGPVLFTFGGDLISPSLASAETKGAHMVELMNALGTDVAVLGNHEFDFGSEVAAQRMAESRFPWLGANVRGEAGEIFATARATHMVAAGGLRIGFVGALTAATQELTRATGVRFEPELPWLRRGVEELRAAGADVVVALTHLDLEEDRRVARQVRGVDLVLGGHDHEAASHQEGRVLVVKAGQDAHWLAKVRLRVEPGAGVRAMGWSFIPNFRTEPHPRLAPIVAAVERRLDAVLSEPLATLATPLDSRVGSVRTREAAIGNLFADALRAHFGADAALVNGGGLRGNREYPAGHRFTRRDLLAEMPFGNAVTLLEVTGAQLLLALENGLSEVETAAGRFPQVSGLTLTYDRAAPAGQRVVEVRVGGAPLDPGRRYSLATTDYLASGGDGYDVLKTARVRVDASGGPLLVNVVADAIRGGVARGAVEGRVVSR
ncbi:MAG: bifunctional metallophosphatase/5'-nucleotidase [Acetobacteraceae bacterium]|nr:bifunctional metallophosphatase/5'-nucleotidase [Acetobacteraceae bacterium]